MLVVHTFHSCLVIKFLQCIDNRRIHTHYTFVKGFLYVSLLDAYENLGCFTHEGLAVWVIPLSLYISTFFYLILLLFHTSIVPYLFSYPTQSDSQVVIEEKLQVSSQIKNEEKLHLHERISRFKTLILE